MLLTLLPFVHCTLYHLFCNRMHLKQTEHYLWTFSKCCNMLHFSSSSNIKCSKNLRQSLRIKLCMLKPGAFLCHHSPDRHIWGNRSCCFFLLHGKDALCEQVAVSRVRWSARPISGNFSNQQIVGGRENAGAPCNPATSTHLPVNSGRHNFDVIGRAELSACSWCNTCWCLVPTPTLSKCHKGHIFFGFWILYRTLRRL